MSPPPSPTAGIATERAPAPTNEGNSHESGEGAHAPGPELIMLFLFVSLLVGVATKKFLSVLKKYTGMRVPYSVVLLGLGGILGVIAFVIDSSEDVKGNQATESLSTWLALAQVPTLILFIFLPALITEACMTTDFFVFTNHLPGHILLAGPGMILQVILIAITSHYMFGYGWGWTECFLFGGILSATDPVAVIALLKELGVLPDLRVLVEGESVLNDGTAIIVFELCKAIIVNPHTTVDQHVLKGLRLVLGAPILGTIFFLISRFWLRRTHDAFEQTIITVCSGYLCYYVAEATPVHTSGVLAIATQGLLMAGYGMQALTREAEHVSHAFWGMLVFCSDTIIFLLAGAIIVYKGFTIAFTARDWGMLFALYVMLTLIRGFMVTVCTPYLRYWGYGLTPQTMTLRDFVKNMVVVTWGGLRGAVGLVLALVVAANHDLGNNVAPGFQEKCLMMTGGIVVLTLMINAVTLEGLIKGMGLGMASESEEKEFAAAQNHIRKLNLAKIEELQASKIYGPAQWGTLRKATVLGGQDNLAQVLLKATGVSHVIAASTQVTDHVLKAVHLKASCETDEKDLIEGTEKGDASAGATQATAQQTALSELEKDIAESIPQLEKEIAADAKRKQVQDANHVRFLLFLKTSYNHQRENGTLKEGPYRALVWAVNKALVELNDISSKTDTSSLLRFEWGWLDKQHLFKLNHYQEWIYNVSPLATGDERSLLGTVTQTLSKPHKMLSQFLLPTVVSRIKEQFQIVKAVIHAHEEAHEQEFAYEESVLAMSHKVKSLAQDVLGTLVDRFPHISMECSTEAATAVVLFAVQADVDKMFAVCKINQRERERLQDQLDKCFEDAYSMKLPFPVPLSKLVHNLPYFNIVPEDAYEQLWEEANLLPAVFEPENIIALQGDECHGMWLVVSGTVALTSSKDLAEHRETKAPSGAKDSNGPHENGAALEGVAPEEDVEGERREGGKEAKAKKGGGEIGATKEEEDGGIQEAEGKEAEPVVRARMASDGVLVQATGVLGELETMARDIGLASHWRDTCTAVTQVTAVQIPRAFLAKMVEGHPAVLERLWQLRGDEFHAKIGPSNRLVPAKTVPEGSHAAVMEAQSWCACCQEWHAAGAAGKKKGGHAGGGHGGHH